MCTSFLLLDYYMLLQLVFVTYKSQMRSQNFLNCRRSHPSLSGSLPFEFPWTVKHKPLKCHSHQFLCLLMYNGGFLFASATKPIEQLTPHARQTFLLTLSRLTTYVCRAASPLNSRTATKVAGGGGFNSGIKDLIPVSKR